ncbi:MAG: RnfABCDGE type electron transport complex subunit G [Candidatus Thermoplasmatota archaeon]|nr:RnfABCDGE type electron transport complex subunit G [Euryarchaeota archaeon]MBU4033049.1 RnfABCDGE type electron transport complex subunit G [Candidatus Thermoplasmatota archaeon]MBU4071114.1 RnfABCDGE type electron transport complex subunit G [Candidatus Thermoplasmatota archaeon]MBU4143696.1 RnfABCDGE type electron transport complex subunit G [Candidatus Thermoplasmatota archaeon]MBU4591790.1 RnfABCDGE type electron transport complex subunit G [Candidatus Thermoplasmatota archaeon]
MTEKRNGAKEFYPVLLVTMIVTLSMTALIIVNSITLPLIEENRKAVFNEKLAEMFGEMDDSEHLEELDVYIVKDGAGDVVGYAFTVIGSGYGGDIDMLVGIESDMATIRGLSVITHSETPGLGAKITEPWFQEQFQGKDINALALSVNGGDIDAISGATISSSAVVDAVKETVLAKIAELQSEGVP